MHYRGRTILKVFMRHGVSFDNSYWEFSWLHTEWFVEAAAQHKWQHDVPLHVL